MTFLGSDNAQSRRYKHKERFDINKIQIADGQFVERDLRVDGGEIDGRWEERHTKG